ncbi:coagulation factor IIIa [Colossoma macropomum]|uniref:coagulation factor IIIa n=1 Tax=Colossoma macropomum TaxID=42526 RepID=UPI001864E6D1|nr:coagulation factor IIIa [Colossoma macropomum]
MRTKLSGFLCVWAFFLTTDCVSGTFPKAQNVTWDSLNFKTLLTWSPKPVNYSYTVEFAKKGQNSERRPSCIQTTETECDLTAGLTDLKGHYYADVLSEPARGETSDLVEHPHTTSPQFIPYQDTVIGKPEFKIEVSDDQRKITLYVTDIPTAIIDDKKQRLTIRDIFKDDLQYKITYRKAKSTGKKEKFSASSEIVLTDLDRGKSYCFNVQAYILSRRPDKQLGELSNVQCSPEEATSIFEEYSLTVIVSAILGIVVIIAVVIVVIVVCCKKQKQSARKRERLPLRYV